MFEINDNALPIKVWLKDKQQIEESCLEQVQKIANMEDKIYHHIALMPDCHAGVSMPIGGVAASETHVFPNMVGVDIGCGMAFVQTNVPAQYLREIQTPDGILGQALVGAMMRSIPAGFNWHKNPQVCETLDKFVSLNTEKYNNGEYTIPSDLWAEIDNGYYQAGTLGGGNHFIEIQEDENGMICIMLHSGSRNFGKKICDYHNMKAKKYLTEDEETELLGLPLDSDDAKSYLLWMNLALDFAMENRQLMLERTKSILCNMIKKYTDFSDIEFGEQINAHHNYASFEEHFGKTVLVHRKGAIKAENGMYGIIPGAMGSYSYIVIGSGNPDSFNSASHGAGRCMGRRQAFKTYSVEKVMNDLNNKGVFLGMENKSDVAEECIWAYKDVDSVIENESDLVLPIKKLYTVCVLKGSSQRNKNRKEEE